MAETVFDVRIDKLFYGPAVVVRGVQLAVPGRAVTALLGPSGCGKSSVIRCLNRMNDLIRGFRFDGTILYHGRDLYEASVDPAAVRRAVGMVFQKAHPFPMSIEDNVAYGLRLIGYRGDRAAKIEDALRAAALWDEVKNDLGASALALSGGQQQRLCIARAVAIEPDVLLMDEPCSALDPAASAKIEDLMVTLKDRYTIVLVTHNLEQARRVADRTAVFAVETHNGLRTGYMLECGATADVFTKPTHPLTVEFLRHRTGSG